MRVCNKDKDRIYRITHINLLFISKASSSVVLTHLSMHFDDGSNTAGKKSYLLSPLSAPFTRNTGILHLPNPFYLICTDLATTQNTTDGVDANHSRTPPLIWNLAFRQCILQSM